MQNFTKCKLVTSVTYRGDRPARRHDETGRPYRRFLGLLGHLATLSRNQVRFAGTRIIVPMLAEPASTQRERPTSSAPRSRSPYVARTPTRQRQQNRSSGQEIPAQLDATSG